MTAWLLVHSPLVGAVAWAGVAERLRAEGWAVVLPELPPPLDAPRPWWGHAAPAVAEAAGRAGADGLVLAGLGAAGPGLPAVGCAVAEAGLAVAGYVFVDADLPTPGLSVRQAAEGDPTAAAELAALAAMANGHGVLPPWCEWRGPGGLAAAVPDPVLRRRLEAACWPVPLAIFDEVPPVRRGWPDAPCAYLALADAATADVAEARGWPTRRRPGGAHLDVVTEPAAVAGHLAELAGALGVTVG